MTTKTVLFIILYYSACCRGQYGLENLGEYINNQVQSSLRPLHNLGPQIRQRVRQDIAPLEGLGERINYNVAQQLAPLDNLGTRIQQQVEEGLKPVRILESTLKVKYGTDGTTIATFSPSGKQFIFRDGTIYICSGSISGSDGKCSGNLEKLKFDKREDFCYAPNKSMINDWYCLASTSSFFTTGYINGRLICESGQGDPILAIKVNDYNNMCKKEATSAKYKYFTNRNLQHTGNGLECSGTNPQICTYSETLHFNSANVIVNHGGTYIFTN